MTDPNTMSRDELLAAHYELKAENDRLQKDAESALEMAEQKENAEKGYLDRIRELEEKLAETKQQPQESGEEIIAFKRSASITEQRRQSVKALLSAEQAEVRRLQHRLSSHRCAIPGLQCVEKYKCGCVWVVDTRQCDGSLELEFDTEIVPTCIVEVSDIRRESVRRSVHRGSTYTLVGMPVSNRSGRRRPKA